MAAYLDIAAFKPRTIMPAEQVDRIENVQPGWLVAQFESSSRWVDMRLAKRMRVPLTTPPEIVKSWVARMVTRSAYLHHGIPATDQQIAVVIADADKAEAEVKEAANGEISLIELAPSDAPGELAVQFGGPRVYSESSPYVGSDVRRDRGRIEDPTRRGT